MTMQDFNERLAALIAEAAKGKLDMTDLAVQLDQAAKALMVAGED